MSECFFLWHWKSRNIVAQFDTAEEAIDVLARSIDETDLERVCEYFLELYKDDEGALYVDSDELVKLVTDRMHMKSQQHS
jgi:hypothetical protein